MRDKTFVPQFGNRFPGQSPREWEEDFAGLQQLFDRCLVGAYTVGREFGGGIHGAAVGASSHVFAALLGRHVLWDLDNPWARHNHRLLYSNGHGPEFLYQFLWRLFPDRVPEEWVMNRCKLGGSSSHPEGIWKKGQPISQLPYQGMSGDLAGDVARVLGFMTLDQLQAQRDEREGRNPYLPYNWVVASDGCVAEPEFWGAVESIGQRGWENVTIVVVDNLSSLAGWTNRRYKFHASTTARAAASGWTIYQGFGHHLKELDEVLSASRFDGRPSLIWVRALSAFGLPSERDARTHGSPISESDYHGLLERFEIEQSNVFDLPPEAEAFAELRRGDLVEDGRKLERLFSGITQAPTFPVRIPETAESTFGKLILPGDRNSGEYVPREVMRNTIIPRMEAWCAKNGRTPVYVSPDIETSTGVGYGDPISRMEEGPDARILDLGANEANAGHAAEALSSNPHLGYFALVSTFLCYAARMRAALNTARRRGLPFFAVYSHADKGLGTDGPTHVTDTEVHSMRLGKDMYDYVCGTPWEIGHALARMLHAVDGAHSIVYPRQKLSIPSIDGNVDFDRLNTGVYQYASYGDSPAVYVIGSGTGLSMASTLCQALKETEISSVLLSGYSISLFQELSQGKRDAIIPEGSKVIWIDPCETSNNSVAGMVNTLPSRLMHLGMKELYYPCLAPSDPELWRFDGLDPEGLLEQALAFLN